MDGWAIQTHTGTEIIGRTLARWKDRRVIPHSLGYCCTTTPKGRPSAHPGSRVPFCSCLLVVLLCCCLLALVPRRRPMMDDGWMGDSSAHRNGNHWTNASTLEISLGNLRCASYVFDRNSGSERPDHKKHKQAQHNATQAQALVLVPRRRATIDPETGLARIQKWESLDERWRIGKIAKWFPLREFFDRSELRVRASE